jgi:hypothetical protein
MAGAGCTDHAKHLTFLASRYHEDAGRDAPGDRCGLAATRGAARRVHRPRNVAVVPVHAVAQALVDCFLFEASELSKPAELSEPSVAAAVQLQADEVDMTADLDEGTDSPASSLTPSPTSREFDAAVVAAFAAREAELAAQPDFDEDDVRWAELASELVDRAASHVQSLPGTVTHQAKGRAVEQAKKDVGDARWIVCTRLPPSLQPDLLGRVAAVECALAQL